MNHYHIRLYCKYFYRTLKEIPVQCFLFIKKKNAFPCFSIETEWSEIQNHEVPPTWWFLFDCQQGKMVSSSILDLRKRNKKKKAFWT